MNSKKSINRLAILASLLMCSNVAFAANADGVNQKANKNSATLQTTQAGAKATADSLNAEIAVRMAADTVLQNNINTISLTPGPQGETGPIGLPGLNGSDGADGDALPRGADPGDILYWDGSVWRLTPEAPVGAATPPTLTLIEGVPQWTPEGDTVKSIILPAHQAFYGRGAARGLFSNSVPSMHFMTTGSNAFLGEALFVIPIPDDIDFNSGFQFRLVWGFQGTPDPADIRFNWRVGSQFFQANDSIPTTPFEFVQAPVDEANVRRNDVLVTGFIDFHPTITLTSDSRFGAMQISIEDPGVPIPEVYLLQVELQYVANRLGKE